MSTAAMARQHRPPPADEERLLEHSLPERLRVADILAQKQVAVAPVSIATWVMRPPTVPA